VIAAITSCTNTSNPSVMIGAGILARNAVQRGLGVKPWVKTSLAPGSKVVTEYLDRAGLTEYLDALGFNLVGYGCTTCIGNSGPLPQEISDVVQAEDLAVVSVLSGNRNFEGRINPDVKMNYLASPPLCVAYALAGTMDIDIVHDPLGTDEQGNEVRLADIWPSEREVSETIAEAVRADMFNSSYADVFAGDEPKDFNSYGSRRGNHEVMRRGTFANIRLRNLLAGGEPLPEGGVTRHFAAAGDGVGEVMPIYDAAMRYREEGVELVVLAGREYGSGSSRDWAAKGTRLLGVRAVIAQSFERIHRANLVGMGVLPLQFADGQS